MRRVFFHRRVARVPGVVDTFAVPRESHLYIATSVRLTMSGKKSVVKKDQMTIYVDVQVRPGLTPFLR